MKFGTRLIVYFLVSIFISVFISGFFIVKSIEYSKMAAVEKDLMDNAKITQRFINKVLSERYFDVNGATQKSDVLKEIAGQMKDGFGNFKIYDQTLNLVATSQENQPKNLLIDNKINHNTLQMASQGDYSYVTYNDNIYFAIPIEYDKKIIGVFELEYPLDFVQSIEKNTLFYLSIGVLCFILLMVILSIIISRSLTRPIKFLISYTAQYSQRNFIPIKTVRKDEIGQLADSFNHMGAQLEEYINKQKTFVSNVSHELRTPLTAIQGYSNYLESELYENEDYKMAVYYLKSESQRLAKMVDDLLSLSKFDSNTQVYHFEDFPITKVLLEVLDTMKSKSNKYSVNLIYDINTLAVINGDKDKIVQVLVNIIDNAMKYSYPDSEVTIECIKNMKKVSIIVTDHGIGISEQDIKNLFTRFFRAENAKKFSVGNGLGLAISKDIVDIHKGEFRIKSNPNGGTIVELIFTLIK